MNLLLQLIFLAVVIALSGNVSADFRQPLLIKTKNAGNIPFSHENHLKSLNNNCSACHNSIFHIVLKNNSTVTMAKMEKGKSCGACHNKENPKTPQLNNCTACHTVDAVSIVIPDFGTLIFRHSKHLGMFTCTDCHNALFKTDRTNPHVTMSQMQQGKSCGGCHDGKSAFSVAGDCVKCHQVGEIPLAGGSVFSHNAHLEMSFACSECHNKIFVPGPNRVSHTMLDMESGKSCGACHNGKTAFCVKSCSKCHPVKEVLFSDDARFNHDKHLVMYSCNDCHNQLFSAGPDNKRISMTQMEKGSSCGSCHDGSTAFSVKGDCDKCHNSTVDIVFKVKETGATTFSHTIHKSMYKCVDCHSQIFKAGKNSIRASMADMEKGSSCGTCHDGKTAFGVKSDCQKCHTVKQIHFRPGSAQFSHTVHIAAYSCKDCHPDLFIPGSGNKHFTMSQMEQGKSCGSCHDDKTAFSVKSNCVKCHPGNPRSVRYELSPTTGNVEFSHKPHIERGYS